MDVNNIVFLQLEYCKTVEQPIRWRVVTRRQEPRFHLYAAMPMKKIKEGIDEGRNGK